MTQKVETTTITHRHIETTAADLHVTSQGRGQPVLMLHGAGLTLSGAVWRQTASRLARNFAVSALDWPDRGWSTRKLQPFPEMDYDELAIEVMDHLDPDRPWIVIGQSFGGGMALKIAAKHPARVRRLVVVAPPLPERLGIDPSAILAPAAIIWGDQDDVIPVHNAPVLRDQLRASTLAIIEGAKHWPHLEKPEAFWMELASALEVAD